REFGRRRFFAAEPRLSSGPTAFRSAGGELALRKSELPDGRLSAADFAVHAAGFRKFQIWLRAAGEPHNRTADRPLVEDERRLPVHARPPSESSGGCELDRSRPAGQQLV